MSLAAGLDRPCLDSDRLLWAEREGGKGIRWEKARQGEGVDNLDVDNQVALHRDSHQLLFPVMVVEGQEAPVDVVKRVLAPAIVCHPYVSPVFVQAGSGEGAMSERRRAAMGGCQWASAVCWPQAGGSQVRLNRGGEGRGGRRCACQRPLW